MNFEIDDADRAFREEVRKFVAEQMPRLFPAGPPSMSLSAQNDRTTIQRWTQALNEKSWLVHAWPAEEGGSRWPLTWPRILEEELALARCPRTDTIGVGFVGPLLCKFGSPAQKRRYLPKIRAADEHWCQGFSEPGAGSDTMSVRTVARRDGGQLLVNGHKIWTSNAHAAEMMFALVKMETPGVQRQQGLTFLLIDMRSPGVTVRPVITIDGGHHLNEVLLENVRVPAENVVGEPGRGWVYARSLLADERAIVAGLGVTKIFLTSLRQILATDDSNVPPLLEDAQFRIRLAKLEVELEALEFMEMRLLHAKAGDSVQVLGPILKLRGCELRQRVTELTLEALGERAFEAPSRLDSQAVAARTDLPDHVEFATRNFLFTRSATLAGGTSEIQRNIIAAVGLGM